MLLVLGDLPFKTKSKQLLYFHNARILADSRSNFGGLIQRVNDSIKLFIARKLFSKNLKYVDYVIVQTDLMRRRFLENNPLFKGKVIVILPAVTKFNFYTIDAKPYRAQKKKIKLFYPSYYYPHKNHIFLTKLGENLSQYIETFTLTVDKIEVSGRYPSWTRFIGKITHEEVLKSILECDALVYLSLEESLGLPLIEAQAIGVPIICVDMPYARAICASNTLFFAADSPSSFLAKVVEFVSAPNSFDPIVQGENFWRTRTWAHAVAELVKEVGKTV